MKKLINLIVVLLVFTSVACKDSSDNFSSAAQLLAGCFYTTLNSPDPNPLCCDYFYS